MSKCQVNVSLPAQRVIELLVIAVPVATTVVRRDTFESEEVKVTTAWSVTFVREKLTWIKRDISKCC